MASNTTISITIDEIGELLRDAAERGIKSGSAGTNVDLTALGIAGVIINKAKLLDRLT
jgi:hypothetical protein